jgi:hypothetical protein
MKKPGEWIAALSANLNVSMVAIEANAMLDLVEVTEYSQATGGPTGVRFFDRSEAKQLRDRLTTAIAELEEAVAGPAINAEVDAATQQPPRFSAVFTAPDEGLPIWTVIDSETHRAVSPQWREEGGKEIAERWAARLNTGESPIDHKPMVAPAP